VPNNRRVIWRDGEFVDWEDATVHILAQGVQRGSLAFDFISVHETPRGAALFRLNEHLARLVNTCRIMSLDLRTSVDELNAACLETVRRNPGATALRISGLVTSVELDLLPSHPELTVFIAAYSGSDLAARRTPLRDAIKLRVEQLKQGRRPEHIDPQAKVAASYTPAIPARWLADEAGFDDVLLLTESGLVTEAPTSNLFCVTGTEGTSQIVTPPTDKVLRGITRDTVMQIAASLGLSCVEADIHVDELQAASEIFLTNTSRGVWPVVQLDDAVIGAGTPGAITRRLQDNFRAIVSGESNDFPGWLHYIEAQT